MRRIAIAVIFCRFLYVIAAYKIEQVRENEDLYLRCGYDYLPNSNQQLIWRKEEQIIAMIVHGALTVLDAQYDQRIVQHDRDALKVLRPTIVDTGRYTCSIEVQHSVIESRVVYRNTTIVFVYGGPHVNSSSEEFQNAAARSVVQLTCSCISWPQSDLIWEQLNAERVLQRRANLSLPNSTLTSFEMDSLGAEFVFRRWTKNSSEVNERVNYLGKLGSDNQKLLATNVQSTARLPIGDQSLELFRCVCKSLQLGADTARLRVATATKLFVITVEKNKEVVFSQADLDVLNVELTPPRNLSATRNGNLVIISWQPPRGHARVDYYILQYRVGDSKWSYTSNINGSRTDHRFFPQHVGLYRFRIVAILQNSRSAYSDELQFQVAAIEAKWEGLSIAEAPWYLVGIVTLVLLAVLGLTVLVVRQVMKTSNSRSKASTKSKLNKLRENIGGQSCRQMNSNHSPVQNVHSFPNPIFGSQNGANGSTATIYQHKAQAFLAATRNCEALNPAMPSQLPYTQYQLARQIRLPDATSPGGQHYSQEDLAMDSEMEMKMSIPALLARRHNEQPLHAPTLEASVHEQTSLDRGMNKHPVNLDLTQQSEPRRRRIVTIQLPDGHKEEMWAEEQDQPLVLKTMQMEAVV